MIRSKNAQLRLGFISTVFFLGIFSAASADEYIASQSQLLQEGFAPVTHTLGATHAFSHTIPYDAHSLPWPVEFADEAHTLGNTLSQFQPFQNPPYFHGGVDIRTQVDFEVRTPVSGRLEAGHYGYVTQPDGSLLKHWKPWPEQGPAAYFEVAVVTDEGLRFEFHHINRKRLPAALIEKLNQENPTIEAGTPIGYAISFPRDYDHIHYNVILPDGTRVNPEYVSPLVPDHAPPQIIAVVGITDKGRSVSLNQSHTEPLVEIVVATLDQKDFGPYEHPPTSTQVRVASGEVVGWDFSKTLSDPEGKFPDLSSVFKSRIRTPDGKTLRTAGGYGTGLSLMRLHLPPGAHGPFKIQLKDAAGNSAESSGKTL